MIYGFGDRYTNRCTTPLAPTLYHTRESNYIFPTKSAILKVFMKPIKTKSAPHSSLIHRVFTSLSFWITLWSLMGAYFFIIGLLHLLFGTKLIPEPLLFSTTIVKVSTILTCFVYTCFFSPKDYLLKSAILFTFLADIVLAINNVSPTGVILFCFAQYFHTARYANLSPKFFVTWTLFIILLSIFTSFYQIPIIYGAGFAYASTLILNLALASKWLKRKIPEVRRAAICNFIGFILFVCCDFTVLISFFSRIHVLPSFLFAPANFTCWLFYFPSQILLANSSILTIPDYDPFDSKLKYLGAKSKFIGQL